MVIKRKGKEKGKAERSEEALRTRILRCTNVFHRAYVHRSLRLDTTIDGIDEISRDESGWGGGRGAGGFDNGGQRKKERKKERKKQSANLALMTQFSDKSSAFAGIGSKSHVPRRQTVSREFLKGAHSTIDVKIIVIAGVYETYL